MAGFPVLCAVILALMWHQQSSVAGFTSHHHHHHHPWGTAAHSISQRLQRNNKISGWRTFLTQSTTWSFKNTATTRLNAHDFRPVPSDLEGVPIAFVCTKGASFIECYADSIAVVDGVEYTIGVPCDYAVAICYFDKSQQLVPIDLTDPLMDNVYPIAESIVEEEFGEELVLQRTPQTLTLVGELEEEEDEEDEDFEVEDDQSDDDDDEEVEVLLTFEHDGTEYNLVRLLDPILLVGKVDEKEPQNRILLTPQESDKVMPILEEMFLEFRADFDE